VVFANISIGGIERLRMIRGMFRQNGGVFF
jgi:hypothetical protein